MTVSEKIRLLIRRRGLTVTALAGEIGMTRQNLTIKLKKDNFTIDELKKIAAILNCRYENSFIMLDTDEHI